MLADAKDLCFLSSLWTLSESQKLILHINSPPPPLSSGDAETKLQEEREKEPRKEKSKGGI